MPRRRRLVLPNVPLHVIQRGHNRQLCFFTESDYLVYLEWLDLYADQSKCKIHAYVLMSNHVHLLISADHHRAPGKLMKMLGQRYVQHFNRRYSRSGTLWEGRYRSCPTQTERYFLVCQRYIELNPVRAGMVKNPADYRWSSYHANALAAESKLVTPHEIYLRLGTDPTARRAAYQALFQAALAPEMLEHIRQATNGNFALGDSNFAEEIATSSGRQTKPGKSGRPRSK